MPDLTIQFLTDEQPVGRRTGLHKAERPLIGDIIACWPADRRHKRTNEAGAVKDRDGWHTIGGAKDAMPWEYLHITDIPGAQMPRMGNLCAAYNVTNDTPGADADDHITLRHRQFFVDVSELSAREQQTLTDEGEVTIPWTDFSTVVKKKVVPIENDETQDIRTSATPLDVDNAHERKARA